MKLSELVEKVRGEITEGREEAALDVVKESLLRVESAKKTFKAVEKAHGELMKKNVEELELDGYEY